MKQRSWTVFCLLLAAVLGSAIPAAADLDAGLSAFYDSDYASALRLFKADGSAEAAFNLGLMYDDGLGVKKDDDEALKWYRRSAELGLRALRVGVAPGVIRPVSQPAR